MGKPRKNFRDPAEVQSVMLRMGVDFVAALDDLCKTNSRSRREIIEILIDEAYQDWMANPDERINPL